MTECLIKRISFQEAKPIYSSGENDNDDDYNMCDEVNTMPKQLFFSSCTRNHQRSSSMLIDGIDNTSFLNKGLCNRN